MTEKQEEAIRELTNRLSAITDDMAQYWQTYSHIGTWQFWAILALFIVPLIVLGFKVDRQRALLIGFYGFAIHVIATYVDSYATTHRMWEYPFKSTPFFPTSLGLDTSLIPVIYMLFYQWTIKNHKNYYLYLGILCLFFAFLFKPLLSWLDLFKLVESSYIALFMFYFTGGLLGKWVTDLFRLIQERSGTQSNI